MSQRTENLRREGIDDVTPNDKDFYYALTTFEVQMLATRSNLMLVFQSMLVTAMAILDGKTGVDGKTSVALPLPFLPIFGIACSFFWLYVNSLTHAIEEIAHARLERANHHIKQTIAIAKKYPAVFRRGNVSVIMTYPFPLLTMGIWIIWLGAVMKWW